MRMPWAKTENRATDYTSLILAGLAAANLATPRKRMRCQWWNPA